MAYGMLVRTPNGLESIANLRSAQLVYRDRKLTTTGSFIAPTGINDSNSIPVIELNDGKVQPEVDINGNTVTWSEAQATIIGGDPSSDFYIMLWRIR